MPSKRISAGIACAYLHLRLILPAPDIVCACVSPAPAFPLRLRWDTLGIRRRLRYRHL